MYKRQPRKIVQPNPSAAAGSAWIHQNCVPLMGKYPDEWIAADDMGLVVHNPFNDELMKEPTRRGVPPESVALAFLQTGAV